MIKSVARFGAVFSFAAFFLAGTSLLAMSGFRLSGEYIILTALGLFFVGTAFFAGAILWVVAEKARAKENGQ